MHTRPLSPLLLGALLLAACGPQHVEGEPGSDTPQQARSALTQVTGFGTNPGNLLMFTHVPASMPASAPVVVVLHGCTQSAAAMEASGWTAAANTYKFYVVYAQQQSANNSNNCFNWFEPGDTARGGGEALSIKQMVDKMKATYSVDPARVFVAGFSAGGYMTPVMLATYPDVFAGGAVNAGGPYGCASNVSEAFTCMDPGVTKTPTAWGDAVRNAFPGYTGARPRVSIWHGTTDSTVKVMNLTEAMKQWTNVHGIDQTADTSETVAGFPHKVYRNASGQALVETYEITNMGHAVAVDPQFTFPGGSSVCGSTGTYFVDVNLCATHAQAQFFGLTGGGSTPGDTTAPTVDVTAPAAGSTVSGTVSITASASDDVGVSQVEFYVDGALVGSDASAPYSFSWNTAGVANGTHALKARALDAAGNAGEDNDTSVTVSNSTSTTVTYGSIAAEDGYVKANADGTQPALGAYANLAVGRGTDAKYNRALLSFDTSGLPDTATITRAYVTVTYSSASGDPWANPAGNTLVVDVKTGTFGAAGTETTDYSAAATASAVASIAKFTSGAKSSSDFTSSGLSAVNRTGRTQLRLRFSQNPSATAYVFVQEGANATLTVVYSP